MHILHISYAEKVVQISIFNTPGNRGGPGGSDRMKKKRKKISFFRNKIKKIMIFKKICIYLLVMPKYWVKNYFTHGSFPEVGQKQKTEKKKEKRKRPKVGDNNGQATHGARKHAWRTQAAWAKNY